MANHYLTANFRSFFGKLNPGSSFEAIASSEYNTIKGLIENRNGPAAVLSPTCFLQGSYRQQTAIYSINDVDIVALCQLWQPGATGGIGRTYGRNEIFEIIAAPLRTDRRYASKLRFGPTSMCIKVDLGIKVEILPVVFKAGNNDPQKEPFRLYRPESNTWKDGYARYHQRWLTWKNRQDATGGNFIPAIKVFKHLRSKFGVNAVSFHIECFLYKLPDELFLGSPADYLLTLFDYIAATPATTWYSGVCRTPCSDRDIFTGPEWSLASWTQFHKVIELGARAARLANESPTQSGAIEDWQMILGADYFPANVS